MEFWEKIRKDVRKGFQDGLAVIREGAVAVKEKAEELTEEGKRQYQLFELKTKVQKEVTELGGKVYGLICAEKDPVADSKIKASVSKIKKLETRIAKLEIKPKAKPGVKTKAKTKATPEAKTSVQAAAKKTAIKKQPATKRKPAGKIKR
ncbi:MAG: hypothetical protein HGA29_02335 [Syntrophaceae bacterium]|nr:hypothetical protein [Syntrophaceae bacterium]